MHAAIQEAEGEQMQRLIGNQNADLREDGVALHRIARVRDQYAAQPVARRLNVVDIEHQPGEVVGEYLLFDAGTRPGLRNLVEAVPQPCVAPRTRVHRDEQRDDEDGSGEDAPPVAAVGTG